MDLYRKFTVIVLLLIFTACKPETDNGQQSIDDLFASKDFEFHMQSPHFKSGSTQLFTIERKKGNYILTSSQSHKGRLLSKKDMADFKALVSQLIDSPTENCNESIFTIQAYNYSEAIAYKSCKDQWDKFNQILKLSEIIQNE